ncbi:MAG: hypothetical protein K2X47_00140, partial [Bdellovibrionales bacterium]|nr:hypothetical protein [Bdellovibrionales bacterium]
MKNVILLVSSILPIVVGCQARPKSDRTVQIKAGEMGKVVTQNLTPIPLLATERLVQSMALVKILIEG